MDLPVYVEKAMALEVLFAFMEELHSESVNLCTRKWLDAILLAANDARHRIDRLRQQLKYLFRGLATGLPLAARFVLSNTPSKLAIQGLNCYIVNVLLIMVIKICSI